MGQNVSHGLILTALGSPERLEDMEPYLLNIRQGRPVNREFVEEMKNRYRQAGGKSPLLEITQQQAQALDKQLNHNGKRVNVYVGMRHWRPYIKSTIEQIAQDGIQQLISLPLTPYYSKLSFEAYHQAVREAVETLNLPLEVTYVKSWSEHPCLIKAFSEQLVKALKNDSPKDIRVLFTAHSLPERILRDREPYPEQLRATASQVAKAAGVTEWDFAYQSQGRSAEPWLGPTVEEKLYEFSQKGIKRVLIAPIGFISDHLEILYDIDILFKKLAKDKGIHLERTQSLNVHPEFIATLASIVEENLA